MISVILLETVKKLGNLGDCISVKPGFARNYLVPQGKALPASKKNLQAFEAKRATLAAAYQAKLEEARERVQKLDSFGVITLFAKAGEEGKLFGSITSRTIADHLAAQGFPSDKSEFVVPGKTLRNLGEHQITFSPNSSVSQQFTLNVVAEPVSK